MKTVDVLQAAKEKIADKKNWAEGALYGVRRGDRRAVPVSKLSEADCFCSIGAVAATVGLPDCNVLSNSGVVDRTGPLALAEWLKQNWPNASEREILAIERATKYLNAAARQIRAKERDVKLEALGDYYAYYLNDDGKHDRVMAMFDRAIKNAKRRHVGGK